MKEIQITANTLVQEINVNVGEEERIEVYENIKI